MLGRPDELKAEKIRREIIDAVLSLWIENGPELRFIEIHQALNHGFIRVSKRVST